MHRDKFLIIEPTRGTNFSRFLFWNETLHVSDSSSVHHQKFSTVNITVVYVIQDCWQLASRIRMELSSILIRMELSSILILLASCKQTCMAYTIVMCTVENSWQWTEELSETYRVSFQNKNLEKLVPLVGSIKRNAFVCYMNRWQRRVMYNDILFSAEALCCRIIQHFVHI